MKVVDIVRLTEHKSNSAIQVQQCLSDDTLLSGYAMTDSAAKVFDHISEAVLPQATADQRAINIYGSYGSGKSHLAVVLSRLLRDGATDPGFSSLISRLENSSAKFGKLGQKLTSTFLAQADKDSKPYFVINLYAVSASSITEQLIEALVYELDKDPEINTSEILPTTQHEVCLQRIKEIESYANYIEKDFGSLGLYEHISYFNLNELKSGLEKNEPDSLDAFQIWHKAIMFGQPFDPIKYGGADLIKIFFHAGEQLNKLFGYAGILIIWDEFGSCLEDLHFSTERNLLEEVSHLQKFIETVCAPAIGHTIFVAVTHVTFQEYSQRMGLPITLDAAFEKIAGRLNGNRPFKVQLSAGEEEGYHLIGMQREWTDIGKKLRDESGEKKANLVDSCRNLEVFSRLSPSLNTLVEDVYPLHPTTALTLFQLSKLSQASRTALSFLRLQKDSVFERLIEEKLWGNEQIRIDSIVDYFEDELSSKDNYKLDFSLFKKATNALVGNIDDVEQRSKILSLLFLSNILGDSFKPTEEFLSCALYDTNSSSMLISHLEFLSNLGIIWKNRNNGFWQLASDSTININDIINAKVKEISSNSTSIYDLFLKNSDLRETFLPPLGICNFAANKQGIVHSYDVMITKPNEHSFLKSSEGTSATVKLVFGESNYSYIDIQQSIQKSEEVNEVYFWLPNHNLNSVTQVIDGKSITLKQFLISYLACQDILTEEALNDSGRVQILSKSEFFRISAINLLHDAFGSSGLMSNKTQIFKLGIHEVIDVDSWFSLNKLILNSLEATYSHPVSVRAANVNVLSDMKPYKKSLIIDIVERILSFNDNCNYHTKYLGEEKVTSELSALVNGVLGVNGFIKLTVDGARLAKVNELSENVSELINSLTKKLTAKKKDGINIYDVAYKLTLPPYGIPRNVMPMFMAFAIRDCLSSLKWSGCQNTSIKDFSQKLVEGCFKFNVSLRYAEFTPIQKILLSEAANVYDISYSTSNKGLLNTESYDQVAKGLLDILKSTPESVLANHKVKKEVSNFIRNTKKIGVSTHESIIEFVKLLEIRDVDRTSTSLILKRIVEFKQILEKASDELLYQIHDELKKFDALQSDIDKWGLLEQQETLYSKLVIGYSKESVFDSNVLKNLIEKTLNVTFGQFTENNFQKLKIELDGLFNAISKFVMPSTSTSTSTSTSGQIKVVDVSSAADLSQIINCDRKNELESMINIIWPTIQNNTKTLDEVEYLIAVIHNKGKESYGC